jgi:Arc/MetJ-type ribon-helix-helix transcriptional regulator
MKMSETEKITFNMSVVDLGKIDLLVQEGLYSNRTDLIRTAIRGQLKSHDFELQQSVQRHSFGIGVYHFSRADLEQVKSEGKTLTIITIGMLHLADDISPELAADTIDEIRVRGAFRAPAAVKQALADRIE